MGNNLSNSVINKNNLLSTTNTTTNNTITINNNNYSKNEYDKSTNNKNNNMKIEKLRFKSKYLSKDPIIEILELITPKAIRKNFDHLIKNYKIKKNYKCQKDYLYTIKVIENTRSGRFFNLKIMKKLDIYKIGLELFKNMIYSEIHILELIKNPNVEQIINIYFDDVKNSDIAYYIVTAYTPKTNLLDIVNKYINNKQKFTNKEIATIIKILLEIVNKFKSNNILFRNFSLENIYFYKQNNFFSLCLRNFYFATTLNINQSARGIYGPLWYLAPEVIKELPYDYKADIWSIGLIMYQLVTLENPFKNASTKEELYELHKYCCIFSNSSSSSNNNNNNNNNSNLYKNKTNNINNKQLSHNFKKLNDFKLYYDYSDNLLFLLTNMLVEDDKKRKPIDILIENPIISSYDKLFYTTDEFKSLFYIQKHKMLEISFKVNNIKPLHDLIFYIVYNLKDYFLSIEDLSLYNEFYKFFDKNNDGLVTFHEIEEQLSCYDSFNFLNTNNNNNINTNNNNNNNNNNKNTYNINYRNSSNNSQININSNIDKSKKTNVNIQNINIDSANYINNISLSKKVIINNNNNNNNNNNKNFAKDYANLIKTIVDCDFRKYNTPHNQLNAVNYNTFLTANILLRMHLNEYNEEISNNIQIMFYELDTDQSGSISIDEIQVMFKNEYKKNIKKLLESIQDSNEYLIKEVSNLSLLSKEDFRKVLMYEVVKLKPDQIAILENYK